MPIASELFPIVHLQVVAVVVFLNKFLQRPSVDSFCRIEVENPPPLPTIRDDVYLAIVCDFHGILPCISEHPSFSSVEGSCHGLPKP